MTHAVKIDTLAGHAEIGISYIFIRELFFIAYLSK